MKKSKTLLVICLSIMLSTFLMACSPLVKDTPDGQKIFISSDKMYQFTAPSIWERDHNTITNGATIAATTSNQEQALIVIATDKEVDEKTQEPLMTFSGFNRNTLTKFAESTDDFVIISQQETTISGYPVIATKVSHTVKKKDTISWIYVMDYERNNQFLRINAFTYHPEETENSEIIERVLLSFEDYTAE
ncbi:MAG: hypothetical protein ACOX05_06905 [Bacillota bacterium]